MEPSPARRRISRIHRGGNAALDRDRDIDRGEIAVMARPEKSSPSSAAASVAAAALSLLKRGIDVEVHEQAPELREVGAGIQISSNGTRVLYALGLEDALKACAGAAVGARDPALEHRRDLELVRSRRGDARRYGTPHVMLHRGDSARLLAATRVRHEARRRRSSAGAAPPFSTEGSHAEVNFEDGTTVRTAPYVIGADGIHSKVRAALFGAARPEFTGAVAWRGLVPMESCRRICRTMLGRQLARAARPCAALSGAARRDHELHQLRRARRLADQILGDAGHQGRARQRFPRLARRCARDHRPRSKRPTNGR